VFWQGKAVRSIRRDSTWLLHWLVCPTEGWGLKTVPIAVSLGCIYLRTLVMMRALSAESRCINVFVYTRKPVA